MSMNTDKRVRDSHGVLVGGVFGTTTSSAKGLPVGYRITRDNMGFCLIPRGKLIRTGADREALVEFALEGK